MPSALNFSASDNGRLPKKHYLCIRNDNLYIRLCNTN